MKLPSFFSGSFLDMGGFGDASWKKKAFFTFLIALLIWAVAFSIWSDAEELRTRRILQRARYNDLLSVLREFSEMKSVRGDAEGGATLGPVSGENLLAVVSEVVGSLGLRENMISLSTAAARGGRNAVSLTLEGLSAEQFAKFLQEMDRRSIVAFSADLRAVRGSEDKRTLTVYLLLGGAS